VTGCSVISEPDPAVDRYMVVQALRDAVIFRFREVAEPCQACLSHPSLLCVTCQGALDLASGYQSLIGWLMPEEGLMTSRPVSAVSAAAVAALVRDDQRPGPAPLRACTDPAGSAPDGEQGLCAYEHLGPCEWPGEEPT